MYVHVTITGSYISIVVDLDSEFVTSLPFLHTFLCYISFALLSPSTVQTPLLRWCLKVCFCFLILLLHGIYVLVMLALKS